MLNNWRENQKNTCKVWTSWTLSVCLSVTLYAPLDGYVRPPRLNAAVYPPNPNNPVHQGHTPNHKIAPRLPGRAFAVVDQYSTSACSVHVYCGAFNFKNSKRNRNNSYLHKWCWRAKIVLEAAPIFPTTHASPEMSHPSSVKTQQKTTTTQHWYMLLRGYTKILDKRHKKPETVVRKMTIFYLFIYLIIKAKGHTGHHSCCPVLYLRYQFSQVSSKFIILYYTWQAHMCTQKVDLQHYEWKLNHKIHRHAHKNKHIKFGHNQKANEQ